MRYLLLRFITVAAAMALLCSTAATSGTAVSGVTGLTHRHDGGDIKVAWQEARYDRNATVTGLIKNLRPVPLADFNVAVFLLDDTGRILARDLAYPVPVTIVDRETAPFAVTMHGVAPDQVRYVAFAISYLNRDGTGRWTSSFRYDLATGTEVTERSLFRDDW